MTYDVAFVGTGPEPENPVLGESVAMAYYHAQGYERLDSCNLVACADLVRENASAFAEEYGVDDGRVYEDHERMLREAEPDVVSVCTPVPTHADLVVSCAETGVPDAIHCEKPMADSWADCERMAEVCEAQGVQLTFDHQRRFAPAWREAKGLLDDGDIGELQRIEMGGRNLYDYGTHLVDLCHFFADERRAEWVLGGLDYSVEDVRYGAHNETQALALWAYGDGVTALASTGDGAETIGCQHVLRGTAGTIEVHGEDGGSIRIRRAGEAEWETRAFDRVHTVARGIEHLVDCLDTGEQPELSADHALRATEVIFGAWESARRRGRVAFPLDIADNPLAAMVESGDLQPEPPDDDGDEGA